MIAQPDTLASPSPSTVTSLAAYLGIPTAAVAEAFAVASERAELAGDDLARVRQRRTLRDLARRRIAQGW